VTLRLTKSGNVHRAKWSQPAVAQQGNSLLRLLKIRMRKGLSVPSLLGGLSEAVCWVVSDWGSAGFEMIPPYVHGLGEARRSDRYGLSGRPPSRERTETMVIAVADRRREIAGFCEEVVRDLDRKLARIERIRHDTCPERPGPAAPIPAPGPLVAALAGGVEANLSQRWL
jgi:hypothetical protein